MVTMNGPAGGGPRGAPELTTPVPSNEQGLAVVPHVVDVGMTPGRLNSMCEVPLTLAARSSSAFAMPLWRRSVFAETPFGSRVAVWKPSIAKPIV